MPPSRCRSACLAFLLFAAPVFAAPPGQHYTHMVESKPVVVNGLEFTVAVEDDWVCFNPPHGRDPVQVQLCIRNVGDKPLLFSLFDTFGINIEDARGKQIAEGGGRDHTFRTKPLVIGPGGTCCLSRKAELSWAADGKSLVFTYYDGTGSETTYAPLVPGSYKLSFRCSYKEKTPPENDDAKFPRWTGDMVTGQVAFKISAP